MVSESSISALAAMASRSMNLQALIGDGETQIMTDDACVPVMQTVLKEA